MCVLWDVSECDLKCLTMQRDAVELCFISRLYILVWCLVEFWQNLDSYSFLRYSYTCMLQWKLLPAKQMLEHCLDGSAFASK